MCNERGTQATAQDAVDLGMADMRAASHCGEAERGGAFNFVWPQAARFARRVPPRIASCTYAAGPASLKSATPTLHELWAHIAPGNLEN